MTQADILAALIFALFAFVLGVSLATRMAMKFLEKAWDERQESRDEIGDLRDRIEELKREAKKLTGKT